MESLPRIFLTFTNILAFTIRSTVNWLPRRSHVRGNVQPVVLCMATGTCTSNSSAPQISTWNWCQMNSSPSPSSPKYVSYVWSNYDVHIVSSFPPFTSVFPSARLSSAPRDCHLPPSSFFVFSFSLGRFGQFLFRCSPQQCQNSSFLPETAPPPGYLFPVPSESATTFPKYRPSLRSLATCVSLVPYYACKISFVATGVGPTGFSHAGSKTFPFRIDVSTSPPP